MAVIKRETCKEYVARRLSEGWLVIKKRGNLVSLSPPDGGLIRVVDLRNDIETLRPNGVGDLEELQGTGDNYTNVNDVEPDEEATENNSGSGTGWFTDLYHIEDHSEGSETINSVKVYARVRTSYLTGERLKIVLKSGTTTDESDPISIIASYVTYDNTWTINPDTESPFTWDEIDALQVGINLDSQFKDFNCRVTQVYVEVEYTIGNGAAEDNVIFMGSNF